MKARAITHYPTTPYVLLDYYAHSQAAVAILVRLCRFKAGDHIWLSYLLKKTATTRKAWLKVAKELTKMNIIEHVNTKEGIKIIYKGLHQAMALLRGKARVSKRDSGSEHTIINNNNNIHESKIPKRVYPKNFNKLWPSQEEQLAKLDYDRKQIYDRLRSLGADRVYSLTQAQKVAPGRFNYVFEASEKITEAVERRKYVISCLHRPRPLTFTKQSAEFAPSTQPLPIPIAPDEQPSEIKLTEKDREAGREALKGLAGLLRAFRR